MLLALYHIPRSNATPIERENWGTIEQVAVSRPSTHAMGSFPSMDLEGGYICVGTTLVGDTQTPNRLYKSMEWSPLENVYYERVFYRMNDGSLVAFKTRTFHSYTPVCVISYPSLSLIHKEINELEDISFSDPHVEAFVTLEQQENKPPSFINVEDAALALIQKNKLAGKIGYDLMSPKDVQFDLDNLVNNAVKGIDSRMSASIVVEGMLPVSTPSDIVVDMTRGPETLGSLLSCPPQNVQINTAIPQPLQIHPSSISGDEVFGEVVNPINNLFASDLSMVFKTDKTGLWSHYHVDYYCYRYGRSREDVESKYKKDMEVCKNIVWSVLSLVRFNNIKNAGSRIKSMKETDMIYIKLVKTFTEEVEIRIHLNADCSGEPLLSLYFDLALMSLCSFGACQTFVIDSPHDMFSLQSPVNPLVQSNDLIYQ